MAFLKRNESDSVSLKNLPHSTGTVPSQAPFVVCQKEGGLGIPTPLAVLLSPVHEATGPTILEQKSCPQSVLRPWGPCGNFHRASSFGTSLDFSASSVDVSDDQSLPKSSKMLADVSSKSSNMLVDVSLKSVDLHGQSSPSELSSECEGARALEPIHSERSSHAPLGHTWQSATIFSSRIGFLSTCLCSCAWVSWQRPNCKKVEDTFPLLRQIARTAIQRRHRAVGRNCSESRGDRRVTLSGS